MENLLKHDQINFEILDSKENLLQVILLPNQSLYTEPEHIIYCSENLNIRDIMPPWYKRLFKYFQGLQMRIKNRKGGVEYVGLSKSKDKIIAVNPNIFDDGFIANKNAVLAFTSGVKIHVATVSSPLIKFLDWREFKGNGLVFLQFKEGLIEKRLGVDEEMSVVKNNIVAFSKGVKVMKSTVYKVPLLKLAQDLSLVKIKGPGWVYFGSSTEPTPFQAYQWKSIWIDLVVFSAILILIVKGVI